MCSSISLSAAARALSCYARIRPATSSIAVPAGLKSRGHQTLRIAEIWQDYVRQLLHETEARA
jgi:hypothetical protein